MSEDIAKKISWLLFAFSVVLVSFIAVVGFSENYNRENLLILKDIAIYCFIGAVSGKPLNLIGEGIRKNGLRVVGDNNYEFEEEEEEKENPSSLSKQDQ